MGFHIDGAQVKSDGIPVGLYDATIHEVSDTETKADIFNEGKQRTQFHLVMELSGGGLEDPLEQWFWVTVPPKLISEKFLSPKSTLYRVLEALGYNIDPDAPIDINTDEWIGKRCQALVEPTEDGKGTKITRLLPARKGAPQGVRTRLERAPAGTPASNGAAEPPYAAELRKQLAGAGLAMKDTGAVVGEPAGWDKLDAWIKDFTEAYEFDDWMAALVKQVQAKLQPAGAVPFE